MGRLLLTIVAYWMMATCNAQVQEPDIWLFKIGEPRIEVENSLKENHYKFKDIGGILTTENPTVNFLGVDWDKCMIFTIYDKVNAIWFNRSSPTVGLSDPLSSFQIKELQNNLISRYGEMREIRDPSTPSSRTYVWYDDDLLIRLVIGEKGYDSFIVFGGEM